MQEDFFWSPVEESAPFGNDAGSDAAYGFERWRLQNRALSPVEYLKQLIKEWHYPVLNWNDLDSTNIKNFLASKSQMSEESIERLVQQLMEMNKSGRDSLTRGMDEQKLRESVISTSQQMNGSYLLDQDNAIIGIGFAQFALEGKIDAYFQSLTITAIKRELLPVLINRFDEKYRETRETQLKKMLSVVEKMGK